MVLLVASEQSVSACVAETGGVRAAAAFALTSNQPLAPVIVSMQESLGIAVDVMVNVVPAPVTVTVPPYWFAMVEGADTGSVDGTFFAEINGPFSAAMP